MHPHLEFMTTAYINQQTMNDLKKWSDEPELDWRIKILQMMPECFMYHESLDDAINVEMMVSSECKGCSNPDCVDCNHKFAEWMENNMERLIR